MAVGFAEALKAKGLKCGDAFFEQRTKSTFVEGLILDVRSNMLIYWTARPATHLRQLAQYADTLVQSSSGTPFFSTRATSQRSTRQRGHNDRQKSHGRERFRAERDKVHAIVTPAENSSATGMRRTRTKFQENVPEAASSTAPQISHCHVCLA